MVVAIDGPAGAGKSTVARATARALGFPFLDSGAMYRAVGLMTLRHGGAASKQAEDLQIELGERVRVGGEDVTEAIRAPEVSEAASRVATNPAVRKALASKQRALLESGDWVAEGRDIGTVVAPDAAVKVFLTASPEERARRRAAGSVRTSRRCCATRRCATLRTRAASTRRWPSPGARWSSTPPA